MKTEAEQAATIVNAKVTPVTNLINRCLTAVQTELDDEKEISKEDLAPIKEVIRTYKAISTLVQKIVTNPAVIEAVLQAMEDIKPPKSE